MENGASDYLVYPRGLKSGRKYEVTIDGKSQGAFRGSVLTKKGINVHLPTDFRAAVVEIGSVKE